ncbi:hypothetical protein [Chromobacterium phragmitis]|uniref:Uncharacterized protein n=1 Tax=Chromobacterium phragmitis TaxID=2202141 RepID=A0ABV0J0C8_9NEIS
MAIAVAVCAAEDFPQLAFDPAFARAGGLRQVGRQIDDGGVAADAYGDGDFGHGAAFLLAG